MDPLGPTSMSPSVRQASDPSSDVMNEAMNEKIIGGFPTIRGTLLGVPIIRAKEKLYWGLYWGPLIYGNYHFEPVMYGSFCRTFPETC